MDSETSQTASTAGAARRHRQCPAPPSNAVVSPATDERYLSKHQNDPEYRATYDVARRRIDQVDSIIQALDDRREALGLSKAEFARRADLAPEVVRRLFSVESPNPTATTLVALADALDLDLAPTPRPERA